MFFRPLSRSSQNQAVLNRMRPMVSVRISVIRAKTMKNKRNGSRYRKSRRFNFHKSSG
jgi:hypothetical protein